MVVDVQRLEIGGPSSRDRGWRVEGRDTICKFGMLELEWVRCGGFEGVEIGVERARSRVGGAEALVGCQ